MERDAVGFHGTAQGAVVFFRPFRCVKEDRMGGRKGKEDRHSKRRFTGEARKTHEHKFPKKQVLSKTSDFVPYKFLFYRNKRAVTRRRRIAAVREVIEESWLTGLTHLRVLQYSLHEMTRRSVADSDSDFKSRIPKISLSRFSYELHPCRLSLLRSTRPLAFIR